MKYIQSKRYKSHSQGGLPHITTIFIISFKK